MATKVTCEQVKCEQEGAGLLWVLFIVFLILKLCKVIDWSWWWVTCPLWISLALYLAVFAVVFLSVFIFLTIKRINKTQWQWIGAVALCGVLGIIAYFLPAL